MRLWSRAGGISGIVLPIRRRSIVKPPFPRGPPRSQLLCRLGANQLAAHEHTARLLPPLAREFATITPLPAASPSALTTARDAGGAKRPLRRTSAASASELTTGSHAVGIWCRAMKSLANALLDSSREAAWLGPTIASPWRSNSSTMPLANGASGPTMVRSIFFADKLNKR